MSTFYKTGGWCDGGRVEIVMDATDDRGRYQLVRTDAFRESDGSTRFSGHRLITEAGEIALDTRSRATSADLLDAVEAGRQAIANNVPLWVIRRRQLGFSDYGAQ